MAAVKGTNAFTDVSEADAYFLQSLNHDFWVEYTSTQRDRALVSSARRINLKLLDIYKLTQAPENVPDNLASGNAEYALAMLQDTDLAINGTTSSNIESLKAGSAEIKYFKGEAGTGTIFPQQVQDLINSYLSGKLSAGDLSFVSGDTDTSTFLNPQIFPLNEGY